MSYAVITEAPGCHGEYSTVQRIVEVGETVRLTQREALHVVGEHVDDPDLDWQTGQRIPGGLPQPEAIGPISGVFDGARIA